MAFQRIRFLYDQQALRTDAARVVPFNVARTRVFLANANLVAYSRKMLVQQLDIPDRVVELVDPFIDDLLNRFWTFTHGARPRQRRLTALEEQARGAYFGLCRADMLATLWQVYERQISERLAGVSKSMWVKRSLRLHRWPIKRRPRPRTRSVRWAQSRKRRPARVAPSPRQHLSGGPAPLRVFPPSARL